MREQSDVERLYILSAFTTPASKGYVYVEAFKETHVKRAILNIRALKSWRLRLVPLSEMVSALKFSASFQSITPHQWVRWRNRQ